MKKSMWIFLGMILWLLQIVLIISFLINDAMHINTQVCSKAWRFFREYNLFKTKPLSFQRELIIFNLNQIKSRSRWGDLAMQVNTIIFI